MRSALFLPLFDELADPAIAARLSAEAEEAHWDGFFVWDKLRWPEPVVDVADPWITLAAIATATLCRPGPTRCPTPPPAQHGGRSSSRLRHSRSISSAQ